MNPFYSLLIQKLFGRLLKNITRVCCVIKSLSSMLSNINGIICLMQVRQLFTINKIKATALL